MPAPIMITQKDLDTASVTYQKRDRYDQVTGKAKEVYAFITFETANQLKAAPHALGAVPSSFVVVARGRSGGSPGTIHVDDLPMPADKYNFCLKSTTNNTWAVVALR